MNVLALSLFVYVLIKAGMGNVWVFYFFYASAFFADCFLIGKFISSKYPNKEEEEMTTPPFYQRRRSKNPPQK
jgi:hypothetical protein